MAFIQLQFRGDTAANWTAANPILAPREMGIETDSSRFKIGNGVTAWNSLGYGGLQGADGSVWHTGSGMPSNGSYVVGDFYLNTANGDYYEKTGASVWSLRGNLKGPAGTTPSAGGSDGSVQYNDGGAWGGEAAFAYDKNTNTLSLAGQAKIPLQSLTDGATIDWDVKLGAKAKVTLGGARQFNAVVGAVEGASYTLWVLQDNTGSRTPTFVTTGAGSFDFGTDGVPSFTPTANKGDVLGFEAITIGGTLKLRFLGIKKGFA